VGTVVARPGKRVVFVASIQSHEYYSLTRSRYNRSYYWQWRQLRLEDMDLHTANTPTNILRWLCTQLYSREEVNHSRDYSQPSRKCILPSISGRTAREHNKYS